MTRVHNPRLQTDSKDGSCSMGCCSPLPTTHRFVLAQTLAYSYANHSTANIDECIITIDVYYLWPNAANARNNVETLKLFWYVRRCLRVLSSISEWVGVSIRSDVIAMTFLIIYKTASGPIPVILAGAFARNGETRNGRQTTVDTDRWRFFV